MSDMIVENIMKTVDSMYPGLIAEGPVFDIISFKGVLNPITVQVRSSAVSSNALIEALASGDFREHMINTPGMQINTIGGKSFIASLPPGGVSLLGGYKVDWAVLNPKLSGYWSEGRFGVTQEGHDTLKKAFNTQSGTSVVTSKTALYVKSLSPEVALNTNGSTVHDYSNMSSTIQADLESVVNGVLAHFNITPELAIGFKPNADAGISGTMSGGEFSTYPDSNGQQWDALLEKYSYHHILMSDVVYGSAPGTGNIRSMPTVPGFSRVFISGAMNGTGGYWTICTYVKGDCWMDIYYGQHKSFSNGGHRIVEFKAKAPSHSFPPGRDANDFPVPKKPTSHPISYGNLSFAELSEFGRRNGNTFTSSYEGCTLFGAPYVDMCVTGSVVSEEVTVAVGESNVTVHVHEVDVDQFRWVIPKGWYKDYFTSGYGVFTPRASNIQANVLNEWEKLEYDEIVLRGLSQPYKFSMTVNTLPEARIYAKGRAKACKDNDWLKQNATKDGSHTWGRIKALSEAYGDRQVFISPQNSLAVSSVAIQKSATPVTYSLVDGVVTRVSEGVTVRLDSQNEDDRGVMLYDKYFGEVTLSGVTWDQLIIEDELESESLTDTADFNVSSVAILPNDPQKGKLVGFGSWIDPFPKGDITDLNDEQLFRLHIKNLIELDRMSRPLLKVINSFGYDTIIRFAK